MKNRVSEKKTVPVPGRGEEFDERRTCRKTRRRKKAVSTATGIILAAASCGMGMVTAPDEMEQPVLLANGEVITPPCCITVEGKAVAIVESEETAQKVLDEVVHEYDRKGKAPLDIEVVEDTDIEELELVHGAEPPEILTLEEAEEKLTGRDGGQSYITVVTVEEQTERETISFDEEYKPEPSMYVGESRVKIRGKEGAREITKRITYENGEPVEEEILEDEIVEEPVQQVILTGTRIPQNYGGSSGNYGDENVSRNEGATYDLLRTPVEGFVISSPFGPRWGSLHTGIDLALAQGNPIYAADSGTVYFSGYGGGYGNLVKIDHGNGMQTYYAHCSQLLVSQGQKVGRGEKIALVGSTGNSTGPHVHFEVIINGTCVDPADYLDLETGPNLE